MTGRGTPAPEGASLPMRQAGHHTRPELHFLGGARGGIEPAAPSLPSMRGWFANTAQHLTSPALPRRWEALSEVVS